MVDQSNMTDGRSVDFEVYLVSYKSWPDIKSHASSSRVHRVEHHINYSLQVELNLYVSIGCLLPFSCLAVNVLLDDKGHDEHDPSRKEVIVLSDFIPASDVDLLIWYHIALVIDIPSSASFTKCSRELRPDEPLQDLFDCVEHTKRPAWRRKLRVSPLH